MSGVRLSIKVVPGSSRTCIAGWMGDALKVRVAAAPERGQANAAVEKLLSDVFGARVTVVSGMTSARKIVEVEGLSEDEVRVKVGA